MDKGYALGGQFYAAVRKKQVVVYQSWAVGYFDEDILPHAGITGIYAVVGKRQTVVMEQVLGHTGALGLPVQPQTSGAVVDMISPVNNVNSSMHFDSADLCPCQVLLIIDMVDMVVLDEREYSA